MYSHTLMKYPHCLTDHDACTHLEFFHIIETTKEKEKKQQGLTIIRLVDIQEFQHNHTYTPILVSNIRARNSASTCLLRLLITSILHYYNQQLFKILFIKRSSNHYRVILLWSIYSSMLIVMPNPHPRQSCRTLAGALYLQYAFNTFQ